MRILTATDGAPHSDSGVNLAGQIHQAVGGSLTLLTVIKHEKQRSKGEAILERAKTLIDFVSGLQTCIRIGKPAKEILAEAQSKNYDLIIVGERSHHGLVRRFLPPTARRVVVHMPCPVLIARGQARPLQRILVCESGRDPSLLNRLLKRLSVLLKSVEHLTILHVMSQMAAAPGISGWELRADARELMLKHSPEGTLLEEDLALLEHLNVHLEAKVRHGLVVQEILAEAQGGAYDLVVIGAHQRQGWEPFLLDDLAHEIIRHVDRPRLVI